MLLLALLGTLGFFSYKLLFKKDAILVPDFSNSKHSDVVTWCDSLETNPCVFDKDYSDTVEKDGMYYNSCEATIINSHYKVKLQFDQDFEEIHAGDIIKAKVMDEVLKKINVNIIKTENAEEK